MIRSCSPKEVQLLLDRKFSRKFQSIEKAARIRLELLDAAISLRDLELPGLRLEAHRPRRPGTNGRGTRPSCRAEASPSCAFLGSTQG
jgi:plasmid maintenance system killer protein